MPLLIAKMPPLLLTDYLHGCGLPSKPETVERPWIVPQPDYRFFRPDLFPQDDVILFQDSGGQGRKYQSVLNFE